MPARQNGAGGFVNPTGATFAGTPPAGASLRDADGDGLTDNEETRGWTVVYRTATGEVVRRDFTSDPFNPDTDADGFTDDVEAQLKTDPRDRDTDDDLLTDWQEYREVYSDPLNADSDGDGLDDGTEFLYIKSSPAPADSDGDEVTLGGYRNVRIADLPDFSPRIGDVNLALDVRFVETTTTGARELSTSTPPGRWSEGRSSRTTGRTPRSRSPTTSGATATRPISTRTAWR